MTVKEYIEELNKAVHEDPSLLDKEVVYSADDEGNNFQRVCYTPTKGYFDGESFISDENLEEDDEYFDEETFNRVLCIN